MSATGMPSAMHARQMHGADVTLHGSVAPGLGLTAPCDGHATDEVDVLLAVTVADCVPVFVVAPDTRAVAVVHAGWRGAAAGVLERGLGRLTGELGADAGELHVHFGPSICGDCYEVGPEVFEALEQPLPDAPAPIDLRAVLTQRAAAFGVSPGRMTVSTHCTRCTASRLYSHRGGDGERQVGYIGMRA